MHCHSLWIFAQVAVNYVAAEFYEGSESSFRALRRGEGQTNMTELYDSCQVHGDDGQVLSMGTPCLATLFDYMLRAVAFTVDEYTAASVKLGKHQATQSTGDIDDAMTQGLSKRSAEIHATHITPSSVHPDGFAAHINVRSGDTGLVVHTNSSHATARLEPLGASKRAYLRTDYKYFTFEGTGGIKMQAHNLNGSATEAYIADLTGYSQTFMGDFWKNDQWDFVFCSTAEQKLFQGMITRQNDGSFNNTYEESTAITCRPS